MNDIEQCILENQLAILEHLYVIADFSQTTHSLSERINATERLIGDHA